MPIKLELRKFYGRNWKTEIRPRILGRAGNCCEHCGKPNHAFIYTRTGKEPGRYLMEWIPSIGVGHTWCLHSVQGPATGNELRPSRMIKVVLTVAHLNHISGDDREENLAALCQWCHLIHDRGHHKQSRETRKDGTRPLLSDPASELRQA